MTLTRSKTGNTPRRPENPGMVETPGRQRRGRRPTVANDRSSDEENTANVNNAMKKSSKPGQNGSVRSPQNTRSPDRDSTTSPTKSHAKSSKQSQKTSSSTDMRFDISGEKDFGGAFGVSAAMIGFPLLMYYMWIGATFFDGKFPTPLSNQTFGEFVQYLGHLAYTGAFPSLKAWIIYWAFFIFEAACYLYLPGVYTHGKPLQHLGGQKIQYYCSGVSSWYLTITLAIVAHLTGLFPLYTLVDEFGPLMSVAIITSFAISIVAYVSALLRGAQHRMTGNHVYDFFMGAELNPRLFNWLDFKMFFEVRIPWFILFLVTLGACSRQYEQYGYVSGELAFLLMAHFLYANACCKGEELITTTWDMYYEKWGFMLIFWNLAGVPLSYCHCTIFLANHHPATYRWPRPLLATLFVLYLFAYWIWDTAGSQKNYFRAEQRGTAQNRKTFPQLPYRIVKNPTTIPVESGDDLLCDGWYKYARKIHYTCDMIFALSWASVTGFQSPFPWFYPTFFAVMITHRAVRDIQRCRQRYGKAWLEYEQRVPYLFIPYVL